MASWMYSGLQLRNENSARITTYWSPFWSKIVKLTYIMRVRCRSDHEITVTDAQMNDMVVSLAVSVPSQITIPKRVLVSSKRTQKACIRMWFDYPNWFVLFRNRNNSKKPFVRLFHFHSDNISRKFRYFFSNASSAVVAIDIRISASYSYHEYQPDAQKRINGGIMRAQQLWIDSHIGERYWGWPYSDSSIVTFIPCICHINQRRWQWSVVDCTIDTKGNWPRHLYWWKWYEKKVGTISRCCHSISKQRLFWQGAWISDWHMVYGKFHLQFAMFKLDIGLITVLIRSSFYFHFLLQLLYSVKSIEHFGMIAWTQYGYGNISIMIAMFVSTVHWGNTVTLHGTEWITLYVDSKTTYFHHRKKLGGNGIRTLLLFCEIPTTLIVPLRIFAICQGYLFSGHTRMRNMMWLTRMPVETVRLLQCLRHRFFIWISRIDEKGPTTSSVALQKWTSNWLLNIWVTMQT